MSMLAEPRKKCRWIVFNETTRSSLANEENNFGRKLMEKMGWSNGKGLGVDLQGDKDHISVHIKNNVKGLGYKGNGYDDEWIKHYDGFEDALATLNRENGNGATPPCNSSSNTEVDSNFKEEKGSSLEALSKNSRARVHYKKFTRGKDLSRLNHDDIACITGSKRAKQLALIAKEEEKYEFGEVGEQEKLNGITVIKGGSIQDYFSMKMAKLKSSKNFKLNTVSTDICESKNELEDIQTGEDVKSNQDKEKSEDDCTLGGSGKFYSEFDTIKKKKKKKRENKDEGAEDSCLESNKNPTSENLDEERKMKQEENAFNICNGSVELNSECDTIKKKKKKKRENKDEAADDICLESNKNPTSESVDEERKRKQREEKTFDICNGNVELNSEFDKIKKKKKKKKGNKVEGADDSCLENNENPTSENLDEKRKRKQREENAPDLCNDNGEVYTECDAVKKKKKNKRKNKDETIDDSCLVGNETLISQCVEEKTKKKPRKEDTSDVCNGSGELYSEYDTIKKKKRENNNISVDDSCLVDNKNPISECVDEKRKRKQREENAPDLSNGNGELYTECDTLKKRKKNKRKNKDENVDDDCLVGNENPISQCVEEKRKKKPRKEDTSDVFNGSGEPYSECDIIKKKKKRENKVISVS